MRRLLSVDGRAFLCPFAERFRVIAGSVKSDIEGYLRNRHIGRLQQFRTFAQAIVIQIGVWALPEIRGEQFVAFAFSYGAGCGNVGK